MTHEAVKRVYLTHEEIVNADIKTLRVSFNKAMLHMSDMQRRLVEFLLTGMSQEESALQAGYSKRSNTGWRATSTKKVQHALAVGREIAARGAECTAEWVRLELKALMQRAIDEGDNATVTNCLREFAKIDGLYSDQKMKLSLAGHDGGPLEKDISNEEWDALAHLQHDIRKDDEETVH